LAFLTALLQREGFIFGLLRFGIWGVMLTYSFEALKHTAQGHFKPPNITIEALISDFHLVFKQLGLFFVLWLLFIFSGTKLGFLPTLALSFFVGFTFPAMIILLIVNEDIGQALNPIIIVGLIYRIGGRYCLLFLFLILLYGAPSALGYTLIRHFPPELQQFLWAAANNFYLLITYHLLGYVILQYHERVNYPVEYETVIEAMFPSIGTSLNSQSASYREPYDPVQDESNRLLREIGSFVQEGRIPEAIELVRPHASDLENLTVSQRYVDLLQMSKNSKLLLEHIPRHLTLLVNAGQKDQAIKYYSMACKKGLDPKLGPNELFKVAGWQNETGRSKEAIHTFSRFAKAHPKHPLVPKAYYLVALIFHERMMKPEKAKGILNSLIKKFPNHEISGFAQSYLARL
jgi:tetratricopeptide (TPR) repeat protein